MTGIQVQINEHAPARFEVILDGGDGEPTPLDRDDPELEAIAEHAFETVLAREVRPLPAGAIRVLVGRGPDGKHPPTGQIAQAVARRILA